MAARKPRSPKPSPTPSPPAPYHPNYDEAYRRLFSNHPALLKALICDIMAVEGARDFDWRTLKPEPSLWITHQHSRREGDGVFSVKRLLDGATVYLFILLELQSKDPRWMSVRILEYVAHLLGTLLKQGRLSERDGLPWVLPVVLWHGEAPWRAPTSLQAMRRVSASAPLAALQPQLQYLVFEELRVERAHLNRGGVLGTLLALRRSRSAAEITSGLEALASALHNITDSELGHTFATWIRELILAPRHLDTPPQVTAHFEEFAHMAVRTIYDWERDIRAEERQRAQQLLQAAEAAHAEAARAAKTARAAEAAKAEAARAAKAAKAEAARAAKASAEAARITDALRASLLSTYEARFVATPDPIRQAVFAADTPSLLAWLPRFATATPEQIASITAAP